ncbi:Glu-tRNA(Gln) amidotransferase subunit GatD [Candidatus Parvarchaeota archaeon]|nr:Glu-tRNA(Gln) amidotransferase subunit GatD [Candidatus Parvarchaeota archaeon]
MYSLKLESLFNANGIKIGDLIRVAKQGAIYEGILLPHAQIGDKNCAVVKLKSGYNVGIEITEDAKIELIRQGQGGVIAASLEETSAQPSVQESFISILGCGGTIASRIEYMTGAVFPSFSPSQIVGAFPELSKVSAIRSKKLFSLLSEDITVSHWQQIAGEVEAQINDGTNGIVLMHGTDVIGYTAAALSFMVQKPPVPVVLAGAQRSSDRGSSDNKMNLLCASHLAKSDIAHVGVCMHGTSNDNYCLFHSGTNVRKMHTSSRDAFKSVNRPPLAKISYPDCTITQIREEGEVQTRSQNQGNTKFALEMNPNVALVYSHPGIKPEFFEGLSSYDGVVIAGTGMGHVPTNSFNDPSCTSVVPAIRGLVDSGVVVAMAPQTVYGRLSMNVYTAGRLLLEAGVIGNNCDWLAETALVKLMWALGQTKNPKDAKELMLTNISGELSQRSRIDETHNASETD